MAVGAPVLSRDPVVRSLVRSLAHAEHRTVPFPNWRLERVLPEPLARTLASLPLRPAPLTGAPGRRELHNDTRRYLAGETLNAFPAARALAEAFQSTEVVQALILLTGALLVGSFVRLEYALDVDGFWLEPHTDIGVKALTFFLQLAGPGQEGLGTDLYLAPGAWTERIPFGSNAALAFVPSDRSWHGFEPRPIAGVRRSIIVNYVKPEWRDRGQLAFPDGPVG
jgi:hypothetical protein